MGGLSYFKVLIVCIVALIASTHAQLQLGFYAERCPKAEEIIADFVHEHIHNAPSLAAALIRMHFHDCFVRGCDASLLLNSTTNQAEKNAPPNLTLRGFDFIDRIKSVVEVECPGVVSCADIIALAARDSIVYTGGPFWKVPTGRRDGVISNITEATNSIPSPFSNFTTLRTLFSNQGLDLKDLVLLSGAHTIGISHCTSFSNRLYNFTGKGDQDPSLDSEYAKNLKTLKCKNINDNSTLVEMDPGSRKTFDLGYYGEVVKRRGLFQSDAALLTNSVTKSLVHQFLQGSLDNFYAEFAKSIQKLGQTKVKTGTQGEIRNHCAVINS
ncbi:PREDICTED: peroxidase 3-like [Lupinus angustifolius]|uniref:peroxidase 3-like n=1 Tax=Lupinus angustifolius TaxID=3871 RepID=UPI00092FA3E4|nr:PREDICTED: peroxidase 3-like [Lupinus angustifolius]